MRNKIFHLAIPCRDIESAKDFYGSRLGCRVARVMHDRVTLDFFGDQLVCHLAPEDVDTEPQLYPRHFGVTFLDAGEYSRWMTHCREQGLHFFREPFTRFAGRNDQHESFVIIDPSNNLLEFKHYMNPDQAY